MPRLRVLRCSLYEDEDEDEREQLEAAYAEEDIAHTFDGLGEDASLPGLSCFLGALTAPALVSLAITRLVHVAQKPYAWGGW
ncbi:hypothetical protein HDZ31DRAFT_70426 [Schizophyllum fasciatum]